MARIDHTNCAHPRTPAGRRACRNAPITMASVAREMFTTPDPVISNADKLRRSMALALATPGDVLAANANAKTEEWIAENGTPAAKRRINAAGRSKEIRANAAAMRRRESAVLNGCVQAALHTTGRCACGWASAGF